MVPAATPEKDSLERDHTSGRGTPPAQQQFIRIGEIVQLSSERRSVQRPGSQVKSARGMQNYLISCTKYLKRTCTRNVMFHVTNQVTSPPAQ
jgi:hypothetical protein